MSADDWRFRPMEAGDLPEICAIELDSFPTPWSQALFAEELRRPEICFWTVAIDKAAAPGSQLIGYGGFWRAVDEAHFTNLAVRSDHRRQGLGKVLLQAVLRRAKAQGCVRATLEVRPSNQAAVALYEQAGFAAAALRPRYYSDNGEDALLMWLQQL
jgi:ribosomal-protein-alanine N-acetyltransferase